MKICVIGQGYIGLPTALLFATHNCEVIGVDINTKIIETLKEGTITIEEEGLQEILDKTLNTTYHPQTNIEKANTYIITVPTPYNKENYTCDLEYVKNACKSILPYIEKENTIIVESTIAPLSMKNEIQPIFQKKGHIIGEDIYLAHCPERVLPGNIIHELKHNNRIVGGTTEKCAQKAAQVYEKIVQADIIQTSAEIAEMSKCMENTYRDVNIALANELVKVCDTIGINALEVIKTANQHPRVNIHQPGPGVGGHCLAIDPYFIYALSPQEAQIIKKSRDTNRSMPEYVAQKVRKILGEEKQTITIFGIAYKGNSDDDRESPSYAVMQELMEEYNLKIYDPHIPEKTETLNEATKDSSLILVLTGHDEYRKLDYEQIGKNMKKHVIFDTTNTIQEVPSEFKLYNYGNISKINE